MAYNIYDKLTCVSSISKYHKCLLINISQNLKIEKSHISINKRNNIIEYQLPRNFSITAKRFLIHLNLSYN